jgi:hypothetical protein
MIDIDSYFHLIKFTFRVQFITFVDMMTKVQGDPKKNEPLTMLINPS